MSWQIVVQKGRRAGSGVAARVAVAAAALAKVRDGGVGRAPIPAKSPAMAAHPLPAYQGTEKHLNQAQILRQPLPAQALWGSRPTVLALSGTSLPLARQSRAESHSVVAIKVSDSGHGCERGYFQGRVPAAFFAHS